MILYRNDEKIRVIKTNMFIRGYIGISIYPFILVRKSYWDKSSLRKCTELIEHEYHHYKLQKSKGWIKYLYDYIKNLRKHGYHNHPEELEAVESESNINNVTWKGLKTQ